MLLVLVVSLDMAAKDGDHVAPEVLVVVVQFGGGGGTVVAR